VAAGDAKAVRELQVEVDAAAAELWAIPSDELRVIRDALEGAQESQENREET
jgi:hypothetical protein